MLAARRFLKPEALSPGVWPGAEKPAGPSRAPSWVFVPWLDGRGLKIGSNTERRWKRAAEFITSLGVKLATRFVNRSIRFAMVRSIVLSALKREKPFTGMVDTAGKDAPRFVGLLPGSPLKSSLISRRSQLN